MEREIGEKKRERQSRETESGKRERKRERKGFLEHIVTYLPKLFQAINFL